MGKIVAWILSLTKIGKAVEPVQKFISGYKTYIAGAAIALPALLAMIQKFSDQGASYLVTITHTEEWVVLMNGLGLMGLRAGIAKAAAGIPTSNPN